MSGGRLLDAGGILPHRLVRLGERGEGGLGVGEGAGLHERHRGQRREVAEQGDLLAGEGPRRAVGGEEHADEVGLDDEGRAADGDDALLADGSVDRGRVAEALVGPVVGRPVGLARRGHEATETGAEGEAHRLEGRRHRAVGRPHEGVTGLGVVERQVGEVGREQAPGAAHDGVEHLARVVGGRELARGVEQGGEAGLALLVHLARLRDAQGEVSRDGRRLRGRDLRDGRVGGQQLEQAHHLLGGVGVDAALGGHGQILGSQTLGQGQSSLSAPSSRRPSRRTCR